MTKREMLTQVSSRAIRILGGTELSKNVMASQNRRKTRTIRRRENRLRRKQADYSHVYTKSPFSFKPPALEVSTRINAHRDETTAVLTSLNLTNGDCRLILCPELISGTNNVEKTEISNFDKNLVLSLLSLEMAYHPNNTFLYYVNPNIEDKVNASLRNEAVFNLRFLHNGYFLLSPDTFCKAVNLIDRFIVKVKVKPKYISCVATASYYIAAKYNEPTTEGPSAETLVQLARCGGTAADLRRMEEIITGKLAGDVDGVTALDFVRAILGNDGELTVGASTRLQIALCSLEVYRYRPSCLALAVLHQEVSSARINLSGKMLESLAKLCEVEWSEVEDCARLVQHLYESYYRAPLPCSRGQLVWTLSRRTRSHMVSSSPTPLDTISEDSECYEDDDLLLDLLFED